MHVTGTTISCIALAVASCVTAVAAHSGAMWTPECYNVVYTMEPTELRNEVYLNAQVLACKCLARMNRCDCTTSASCKPNDKHPSTLGDRCELVKLPVVSVKGNLACGCINGSKNAVCGCKDSFGNSACSCGIDASQANELVSRLAKKVRRQYPYVDPFNGAMNADASNDAFTRANNAENYFYSTKKRIAVVSRALTDVAVQQAQASKGPSTTKILGTAALGLYGLKKLHDLSHWTPEQRQEKLDDVKSKGQAGVQLVKRKAKAFFAPAAATAKAA